MMAKKATDLSPKIDRVAVLEAQLVSANDHIERLLDELREAKSDVADLLQRCAGYKALTKTELF